MGAIGTGVGGIGFLEDEDTALLLRFHEPDVTVRPSDTAGGLNDLVVPAGLTAPTVVDGVVGRARQFGVTTGYEATEAVAGTTRLDRDVTIEALVSFATGNLTGTAKTVIARGRRTGADAEILLWALRLLGSGGPSSVRFSWAEINGTVYSVDAAFAPPSGFFYVAAVRRWISTTSVEVDFYVDGAFVATVASTKGNIGKGVGGTVTVGHSESATVKSEYWEDAIDDIRVSTRARTAEEIAHTQRQLLLYPDLGYDLVRACVPPGRTYSEDRGSVVQRELQIEGDGLGLAWGLAEELLDAFLPDRATRTLARWERITRLYPKPGDLSATRRARVLGHLRKVHGFNRDEIRAALAVVLALTEAQVQILEVSNRFLDDFADADPAPSWAHEPGQGTIVENAGQLRMTLVATKTHGWIPGLAPWARVALASGVEVEAIGALSLRTLTDAGDAVSVLVHNRLTLDTHHFGVIKDAGVEKFFHDTVVANVRTRTILGSPSVPGSGTLYLRIQRTLAGTVNLAFTTATDGWFGPWTTVVAGAASIANPEWAGIALQGDAASATGTTAAEFTEVRVWMPHSPLVWRWYIFRDPGIGGAPDLPGAQMIVTRMQPAHTRGTVVQSPMLLCDSATDLVDRDPLGGY